MNAISVTLSQSILDSINGTRKKGFHPETWRDNVAKRNKNSGHAYLSRNGQARNGKAVPAHAKVCSALCAFPGCLIPLADKVRLYTAFYSMSSYNLQGTFLFGLIELYNDANGNTFRYNIMLNGTRLRMCKLGFLDTFQITPSRVQILQNKIKEGNVFVTDGRGQHQNHPTTPVNVHQRIRDHIDAFPKLENHYSRGRLGQFYLSPDLNLDRMFRIFVQANPNIVAVGKKENLYRQIFRESGLTIGEPKSDTCKTCDRLDVNQRSAITRRQRQAAQVDQNTHHILCEAAMQNLQIDLQRCRIEADYVTLCGDLQQVLFCPTLTHADMFYKRQLSSFNYCIYNGANQQGTMCFWPETVGNRGSNEVASCLLLYVENNFVPLINGQIRVLNFWSDRCRGQTNNFQLLCVFKLLLVRGFFTTIHQKFMVTGHSYLPCDRLFGLIEKEKKKSSVMTPNQWMDILRRTKVPGTTPFIIQQMTQNNIVDLNLLMNAIPRPNTLQVTRWARFRLDQITPHIIYSKADFLQTTVNWEEHIIRRPNQAGLIRNRPLWIPHPIEGLNLPRAYQNSLPISYEKREDLMSMLPMMLPEHRPFYQQIRFLPRPP